jgi:hypothetical protein
LVGNPEGKRVLEDLGLGERILLTWENVDQIFLAQDRRLLSVQCWY